MKDKELYKKYPHIVDGSIEITDKGKIITCGKNSTVKSHGKICIITCKNSDKGIQHCLKTRIINIQDARQVTLCVACTRHERNTRRRQKRNASKN